MSWFAADVTAQHARTRHQEWCRDAETHNQVVANAPVTPSTSVVRKPRLRLAGVTHLITWMR